MTKLILFEGIPGSGKTTLAKRLEKHLNERGLNAICFTEGESHPADLAWCSVLSKYEYEKLLSDFPGYKDQIEKLAKPENGKFIVPYLGILNRSDDLAAYLEEREPFNGKLSKKEFLDINMARWENFAKQAVLEDKVYIFECVYLQNHINELLLFHQSPYQYILDHFIRLYDAFKNLNPLLIYLDQADVEVTIGRAAESRISADGNYPDWIDMVIDYIDTSPYGRAHNLNGYEGTIRYLKTRAEIERQLINDMEINARIIGNDDFHWDEIFNKITEYINPLLA